MGRGTRKLQWTLAGLVALNAALAVTVIVRAQATLTAPLPASRNLLVTPTLRPHGAAPNPPPASAPLTLPTMPVPPVHDLPSPLGTPFPGENQVVISEHVIVIHDDAPGAGIILTGGIDTTPSATVPSAVLGAPTLTNPVGPETSTAMPWPWPATVTGTIAPRGISGQSEWPALITPLAVPELEPRGPAIVSPVTPARIGTPSIDKR